MRYSMKSPTQEYAKELNRRGWTVFGEIVPKRSQLFLINSLLALISLASPSGLAMAAVEPALVSCITTWAMPAYPQLALNGRLSGSFKLEIKFLDDRDYPEIALLKSTLPTQTPWGVFEASLKDSLSTMRVGRKCHAQTWVLQISFQIVSFKNNSEFRPTVVIVSPEHFQINGVPPKIIPD